MDSSVWVQRACIEYSIFGGGNVNVIGPLELILNPPPLIGTHGFSLKQCNGEKKSWVFYYAP